jgi:hypothetical protein
MALHDPLSPSPGEIGGIFAGVVALLATIGAGLKFILNWAERRASSRAAKLQVWHDELADERAVLARGRAEFEAGLKADIGGLRKENQALRLAFQLVASPLRAQDPGNPNLVRAEQLLVAAFPLDPELEEELRSLLAAIE